MIFQPVISGGGPETVSVTLDITKTDDVTVYYSDGTGSYQTKSPAEIIGGETIQVLQNSLVALIREESGGGIFIVFPSGGVSVAYNASGSNVVLLMVTSDGAVMF